MQRRHLKQKVENATILLFVGVHKFVVHVQWQFVVHVQWHWEAFLFWCADHSVSGACFYHVTAAGSRASETQDGLAFPFLLTGSLACSNTQFSFTCFSAVKALINGRRWAVTWSVCIFGCVVAQPWISDWNGWFNLQPVMKLFSLRPSPHTRFCITLYFMLWWLNSIQEMISHQY